AWPGGPAGAATATRSSAAFEREDVQAALARLAVEFADAGRVGPRSYARFMGLPAPARTTWSERQDRLPELSVLSRRPSSRCDSSVPAEPTWVLWPRLEGEWPGGP